MTPPESLSGPFRCYRRLKFVPQGGRTYCAPCLPGPETVSSFTILHISYNHHFRSKGSSPLPDRGPFETLLRHRVDIRTGRRRNWEIGILPKPPSPLSSGTEVCLKENRLRPPGGGSDEVCTPNPYPPWNVGEGRPRGRNIVGGTPSRDQRRGSEWVRDESDPPSPVFGILKNLLFGDDDRHRSRGTPTTSTTETRPPARKRNRRRVERSFSPTSVLLMSVGGTTDV